MREGNVLTIYISLDTTKQLNEKINQINKLIMQQKKYNGYTNYETWNVALWIDNDQRWNYALMMQCKDYNEFTRQK